MTRRRHTSDNVPAGRVTLVGAGPGDPGLLTIAGRDALAAADVVVYDALANPTLLAHASRARHVYAGKRAEHHAMPQEAINALLVSEASTGRRVVRLKGGDSFVFGRGGEEAEACVAAGVRFDVVPGVTAAVAAAAYAGIPVTHRDLNTSLTLVTGHEKDKARQSPEAAARPGAESERVDWHALARLPLLCFYMGVKSLDDIARNLVEARMDADTPAATVQWGTLPRQRTVVATVATIAQAVRDANVGSPAITYVGRVVALRETLRWFDKRPLSGRTVVVTRTREQASDLSRLLAEEGAHVVEAPTLRIVPPADAGPVDAALRELAAGRFDDVAFTSVNGVEKTRERLDVAGLDARAFAGTRVAAVGPATADACRRHLGIVPDVVPRVYKADALADAFGDLAGRRVLLLRADIGRASLVATLRERGADVRDVAVYETRRADAFEADVLTAIAAADAVTFTSGSTARHFAALAPQATVPAGAKLVSIGPETSAAMRDAGLRVDAEADAATLAALSEAVVRALT